MDADAFGNAVTCADAQALAAIDDFVFGLLSYQTRTLNVLAAAERVRAPLLVKVYAGFLQMLGETPGAGEAARPFLDAARAIDGGTPREMALADVLDAWIADDLDAVVAGLTAIIGDHPSDLATLKLLHYHLFNRGDFPAMLRATEAVAAGPALPYLGGMRAFAFEQLHLLADAEAAAREGLAQVTNDPWSQHALAHVMLTQGRIDEGVAALEGWAPGWAGLNSFMITHLWWHLALFYLSQGRDGDALAAYDDQVWAHARDYSQDQIGAVSLLARLELAGIDVGERWDDLATYLAARASDVVQPFLSVQYLHGLARAGRTEAAALLAAIEHVATHGPDHSRVAWRTAGLPLAQGVVAYADGDFATAADWIAGALPHLIDLGGSHAQRDLFEQLLIDAYIRAGRLIEAQQMLELRRLTDPHGVALNRLIADVYSRLDLPALADEARARIARRLAA